MRRPAGVGRRIERWLRREPTSGPVSRRCRRPRPRLTRAPGPTRPHPPIGRRRHPRRSRRTSSRLRRRSPSRHPADTGRRHWFSLHRPRTAVVEGPRDLPVRYERQARTQDRHPDRPARPGGPRRLPRRTPVLGGRGRRHRAGRHRGDRGGHSSRHRPDRVRPVPHRRSCCAADPQVVRHPPGRAARDTRRRSHPARVPTASRPESRSVRSQSAPWAAWSADAGQP